MSFTGPKGWHPGLVERRYDASSSSAPASFDKATGSVECVISKGAPVQRFYGTETLRISKDAVDLSRLKSSGISVLDSHQQVGISNSLGRLQHAWIEGDALVGRIKFHQTPEGKKAQGMTERGEIVGISAGYAVTQWRVSDADGRVIDTDKDQVRWDEDLNFEAVKWMLHEVSLVSTGADAASMIRSLNNTNPDRVEIQNIRARMMARERMAMRERMSRAQIAMRNDWN
jgi:phage head maturation protease